MTPAATAVAENVQTGLLRQQRPNGVSQKISQMTAQSVTPFVAKKLRRGSHQVSEERSSRTIGKRVADALKRRVGAGRAVTIKQLAYAIRISEQTVWNLLSGNSDPSGRVLMGLLTFFDSAFANEILAPTGCTVAKLGDARAEALAKVAEGMEALRRLG
jgi:transcriptional regulator with XRE-family HTH domain